MHTVHLAEEIEGGVPYAAMGIFFSVNKYSRKFEDWEIAIIDEFFDTLEWDVTAENPKVHKVTYGKLMNMVDMNNRWTYRGSVTTPPCATSVYWNVLRTVYPIKEKHLNLFKKQLERGHMLDTGNYRITQPLVDFHKPYIITSGYLSDTWVFTSRLTPNFGKDPIVVLIFIIILASLFFMCYKTHLFFK